MATVAVLFAPTEPIPTERDDTWHGTAASWCSLATSAWGELTDALSEQDLALASHAFRSVSHTSNFMAATMLEDPKLKKSARSYVRKVYDTWVKGGRKLPAPQAGLTEFAEVTGTPSAIRIEDLVHRRDSFQKVSAGKRPTGASHAWMAQEAAVDAFPLGQVRDYDLAIFHEIVRAYGGDHLMVWTYGRAVHVLHARSTAAGTAPRLCGPLDFRVDRGAGRSGDDLASLRESMSDGPFQVDWSRLESQLDADTISITEWFGSFGIRGVHELTPVDREGLWRQFDDVARTLLSGGAVTAKEIKPLNAIVKTANPDIKLRTKPQKKPGVTSRSIADTSRLLASRIGTPETPESEARRSAATRYWDISSCPASDRLTYGTDKKHLGDCAAVGRLLGHYPRDLVRDPRFLAEAAFEAEAANGHAFVEPLYVLSEHAADAGFTVVILNAADEAAFRRAFGIESQEFHHVDGKAAHAFVDLPGYAKLDPLTAVTTWVEKNSVDAVVARGEADGAVSAVVWPEQKPPAGIDQVVAAEAARDLWPRGLCEALGEADLLAPGEWREGTYAGGRADNDAQQRFVRAAFAGKAPKPQTLSHPREMRGSWRPYASYRGSKRQDEDGIVSIAVEPNGAEPAQLRALCDDLTGEGLIARYGSAWVERSMVFGYTRSALDIDLLATVLADLPGPIAVDVDIGGEERVAFVIKR